jgi:acylphosphatase
MNEFYCKVYGNVQGVFYRSYLRDRAQELGIVGYAKNMPDGTVEVVAQGGGEALEAFLKHVQLGPDNAEVESVDIVRGKAEGAYKDFSIE